MKTPNIPFTVLLFALFLSFFVSVFTVFGVYVVTRPINAKLDTVSNDIEVILSLNGLKKGLFDGPQIATPSNLPTSTPKSASQSGKVR